MTPAGGTASTERRPVKRRIRGPLAEPQPPSETVARISRALSEAALAAPERDTNAGSHWHATPQGEHELEMEERNEGQAVVISLAGRLTDPGAPKLEARVSAIVGRGARRVVLECGRMSYVNSTGMRAMLLSARICQQKGGKLAIADLQPKCRSVVDMSGFLSVIEYHETSESAVAALA